MRSSLNKARSDSPDPTLSWGYVATWVVTAVIIAGAIFWSGSLIDQGDVAGGVTVGLAVPGVGAALLLVLSSRQRPLLRWIVRASILLISAFLFLALNGAAQAGPGQARDLISPSIALAGWLGVFVAFVGDVLNDYYPKRFS